MKIKAIVFTLFLLCMLFLLRFYYEKIDPHTHYLENLFAYLTGVLVVILFMIILLIKKQHKIKLSVCIVLFLSVLIVGVSFWGVRPYYIVYEEVPKRIELLESHLTETYPDRTWEITQSDSTFESHYLMLVRFDDEPDTLYHYFISDDVITGEKELKSSGSRDAN
ncbi:hypothetical protein SAMN04487944_12291 [Gracilibacillus ureilyticus]|uniref:Uncharacterized protein n=1 Tax=Gracilibacillus ureilyticus TaxID=531814 RepID=A0A1H9VBK2_9BACI|nr:hypothetical protein [Gracilibacillus ureilyticus]SES18949.1 hypothetical protein SAMN04487944_12291 [Gracilibacillus ureilyticus]